MIIKQVETKTSETPSIDLVEQLGKAEGNLKFLAQAEMATFTQGEAVLDALHAVQQAFELSVKSKKKTTLLYD